MLVLLNPESPFNFFVGIWWASFVFHMALYYPFWLTKAGHWSSLSLGD